MDLTALLTLKDALEGAKKNTDRMIFKLNQFETRLSVLDENMSEIQVTTERYIKAKDNISLTLLEMEKTYEYFRVANEVKEIIHQGLLPSNQKEYLQAVIKLSQAKQFFETHREIKSSSSVLISIESLIQQANEACETEFEKLLGSAGKSVEFIDGQCQVAHPFSATTTKDLKTLCDAFESSKHTKHYKIYQSSRIQKLKSELKELEASNANQWHSIYTEDPYQRGTYPFHDFYFLSYWLIRSEYQLWGSTLPTNEESLAAYIAICEAALSEIVRVLTPLLTDEAMKGKQGVNSVIRQSKHLLVRLDVLDVFSQKYEEYRDICHPDSRHESSASLRLNSIRETMVEACVKSLEHLLSSSINEGFNDSKASRDSLNEALACDVHPTTGNILYCCKELSPGYSAIYRKMFDLAMGYGIHGRTVVAIPGEADDILLSLLENLLLALETRGEQFDEQLKLKNSRRSVNTKAHAMYEMEDKNAEELILSARKHLFLANNLHSIFNYLKDRRKDSSDPAVSSDKNRRVGGAVSGNRLQKFVSFSERIESKLKAEMNLFCESIAIALGIDAQGMNEFQSSYSREPANQHRLLKAKFAIFNTGLDALLGQQGEWRVSSSILRESLSSQLVGRVSQSYTPFFQTYSTVKFSKKHMEEYLKYTPAQVESNLKGFFGKIVKIEDTR